MTEQTTSHSHTPGDVAEVARCPECAPLLCRISAVFVEQAGDDALAARLREAASKY